MASIPVSSTPIIELRGLAKSYREGEREHRVLRGLDLEVAEGEIVVFLGRSGSGKSTLLNLLSGIDLPSTGSVRLGGTALEALSERERTLFRRERIGFIFQFFNLIPTLTVEENLLLPLELNGVLDEENRRRALGLLERVGLGSRAGSYPDVLSGGEQQRVAIARALVHEPLLLLADEPTGNLDEDTAASVLELLVGSVREAGKTLLIATHSREIAAVADRVFSIHEGHLERRQLETASVEVP